MSRHTISVRNNKDRTVDDCYDTDNFLLIHEQDGEFVLSGNLSPELLLKLAGPALGEKLGGIFNGLPFRR